jgi:hypothetical protein
MSEFNLTFICPEDGRIFLDVHQSSGTSKYAKFESCGDVRHFLSNLGLHEDKVAEVEAICCNLHAGQTYHETMVLPESITDTFANLNDGNQAASTFAEATRP